jgi:spermidine synthase
LNVIAAAIFYSRRRPVLWIGSALTLSIAICLLLPSWQPAAISLGPFVQARRQPAAISAAPRALREWNDRQEVLFHRDGREASYTVKQTPDGERSLWINGKPDASSSADLPTQRLLGQLPLLLAADRNSALVIGVASGSTLHSMATHPLQRIEAVERSLMTRELASWFFDVNGGVLDDPRLSLIEADGRLHLSLTDQQYDVIVSEPSNPWIVGVGDLYTREFFQIVRRRLMPRGRFCLWLPAYHVDRPLFASVVASFTQIFPHSTLWHTQGSDYLLVGTLDDQPVPQGRIERRLAEPQVGRDLEQIGIYSSADLLASLIAGDEALRRFAATAVPHTDDNALLEYYASRRLLANPDEAALLMAIEQHRDESVPLIDLNERASRYRRARGAAIRSSLQLSSGATAEAISGLKDSARANPNDRFLEQTLASNQRHADQLAASGKIDEARARYELLLSISPQREATLEGWRKLQP